MNEFQQDQQQTSDSASVEQMVADLHSGKLSRRKFVLGLTALGVTGAGAARVLISASASHTAAAPQHKQHLQLHDRHVTSQVQGNVEGMMNDYADHAVVEDPLFDAPFVGKQAIATRYASEIASVPDRSLTILNRAVVNNQLIVEWEARGTHSGSFLGFGGTGRPYVMRGTTVIVREKGKIVREAHYYDTASLHRQVMAV